MTVFEDLVHAIAVLDQVNIEEDVQAATKSLVQVFRRWEFLSMPCPNPIVWRTLTLSCAGDDLETVCRMKRLGGPVESLIDEVLREKISTALEEAEEALMETVVKELFRLLPRKERDLHRARCDLCRKRVPLPSVEWKKE